MEKPGCCQAVFLLVSLNSQAICTFCKSWQQKTQRVKCETMDFVNSHFFRVFALTINWFGEGHLGFELLMDGYGWNLVSWCQDKDSLNFDIVLCKLKVVSQMKTTKKGVEWCGWCFGEHSTVIQRWCVFVWILMSSSRQGFHKFEDFKLL